LPCIGSESVPKERIEVFCRGVVLQPDNYRVLQVYGWSGFKKMILSKQDKGRKACAAAFLQNLEKYRRIPN
jgi:hypothetical protein